MKAKRCWARVNQTKGERLTKQEALVSRADVA